MEYLGKKIKEIRISKEMTQRDMANCLGITQTSYQRIETNQTSLTIDRLKQISEVFEMDFLELLGANGANSDCSELEKKHEELKTRLERGQKVYSENYTHLIGCHRTINYLIDDMSLVVKMLEETDKGKSIEEAYKISIHDQEQSHREWYKKRYPNSSDELCQQDIEETYGKGRLERTPYEYFKRIWENQSRMLRNSTVKYETW